MPEIVSDEYREGYAAFNSEEFGINPYINGNDIQFWDWKTGWEQAVKDWAELIGEKSV